MTEQEGIKRRIVDREEAFRRWIPTKSKQKFSFDDFSFLFFSCAGVCSVAVLT